MEFVVRCVAVNTHDASWIRWINAWPRMTSAEEHMSHFMTGHESQWRVRKRRVGSDYKGVD